MDLVKVCAVVLVALLHATFVAQAFAGPMPLWSQINFGLTPFRIPAFFLCSGVLAAAAVQRPWRDTRGRTLGMLYLYTLWVSLFVCLSRMFGHGDGRPVDQQLFTELVTGHLGYWYLLALPVFFVLARLARSMPTVPLLAAAATLHVSTTPIQQSVLAAFGSIEGLTARPTVWLQVSANLVFFLIGVRFGARFASARFPIWLLAPAGVVALGLAFTRSPWGYGLRSLVVSLTGLVVVVVLARVLVERYPRIGDGAVRLGPQALAVYVLQFPLLLGVVVVAEALNLQLAGAPAAVLPPVLTIVVVVVAILLARIPIVASALRFPRVLRNRPPAVEPDPSAVPERFARAFSPDPTIRHHESPNGHGPERTSGLTGTL